MAYIATKPCRFAGQSFKVGEIIPADFLQPGASKNLVKMGIIAEESGGILEATPATTIEEPKAGITIVVHSAEGNLDLNPTQEGLQAVFDVLTANVSAAEPIITEMTDEDALILLHISDSRKSVRELAETRAKALAAPQEGVESEGEE